MSATQKPEEPRPGEPGYLKELAQRYAKPPKPVEQPRRAPRSIIHLLPDDL